MADPSGHSRVLRPATVFDLAEVASWIPTAEDCELWAGWRVTFPIDLALLPAAIDFTAQIACALVHGQELVAFGQVVSKPHGRGHLARLIVKPALRGQGHGEALVVGLVDRARGESFRGVSLNVHSANRVAASLYLKLGFADATRPADEPVWPGTRYMELAKP